MSQKFKISAIERLKEFAENNLNIKNIEQLTPDASTREFFRLFESDKTSIACVYPEQFDENLPQIDVTDLFLKSNLPVAEIYNVAYEHGIVQHQDFGDTILRDVLEDSNSEKRERLINEAIVLIAKIQNSTSNAFEFCSIAGKLKFDEEKLLWELNFFKQQYFESLKNSSLNESDSNILDIEFRELSVELERYANVVTHRDFHAANLMLDSDNNIRIIDHQDARLGSSAYDLVSLLLDRITELPKQDWLHTKKQYFLDQLENVGLERFDFDKFNYEFELVTIQRCLKAIGTFSNQAGNFGKDQYVQYIDPMFKVVLEAAERLQRFPHLQRMVREITAN